MRETFETTRPAASWFYCFRAFGYLFLISIEFYDFSVFSFVLVSIEKIYQTLKTVFDDISKHLKLRQKYSAVRRIFNPLLGVWKCGQTRSFVFDILLTILFLTKIPFKSAQHVDTTLSTIIVTAWNFLVILKRTS